MKNFLPLVYVGPFHGRHFRNTEVPVFLFYTVFSYVIFKVGNSTFVRRLKVYRNPRVVDTDPPLLRTHVTPVGTVTYVQSCPRTTGPSPTYGV